LLCCNNRPIQPLSRTGIIKHEAQTQHRRRSEQSQGEDEKFNKEYEASSRRNHWKQLRSLPAIIITSPPKVIWEEPRRYPTRQRMDSPAACASCAMLMLTADESNHSAAGHYIHIAVPRSSYRLRYIALSRPHSSPKRQVDRLMHFYTTKEQSPFWLQ